MCERGRRTTSWIRVAFEVHGCNETAVHREDVNSLTVGKNIALKALDELGGRSRQCLSGDMLGL
jgi:hypothetical protein